MMSLSKSGVRPVQDEGAPIDDSVIGIKSVQDLRLAKII
ncbi:MAG: hypothetical protein CM15mP33_04470 [Candidatus Neomarinimicrobiota bacterium]|nr:MAG: hypothetical protein CM15mP33_04470 [Candidatus Neomarinimicrobiota bacterium]